MGRLKLMAYFLGLDPALPVVRPTAPGSFILVYRQSLAATGLRSRLRKAATLAGWESAAADIISAAETDIGNGTTAVTLPLFPAGPAGFRLEVERAGDFPPE